MTSSLFLRLPILTLVPVALATAPAFAEQPATLHGYFEPTTPHDLEASGFEGALGRIVHGDPAGDRVGAMFFLSDGEIVCNWLEYLVDAPFSITTPATLATDIVVIPSGVDPCDVLVFSDSTGLSVVTYDATTGFAVASLPATGAWANATQLRRTDTPTGTVVSGVAATGKTVLGAYVDETGATPLISLTIALDILSFDLIDWNGNDVQDIAVVTTLGLYVFKPGGGIRRRELVNLVEGQVARFDDTKLAFTHRATSSSATFVSVVDGSTTEPPVKLRFTAKPLTNAVNMTAEFLTVGDYNADGAEDLFIQTQRECGVVMINRDIAGTHFSNAQAHYEGLPLTNTPHAVSDPGQSLAYFGDVDSDPGDDVIIPHDEEDAIHIFTRVGDLNPGVNTIPVGNDAAGLVSANSTYDLTGVKCNLALDIPAAARKEGVLGYTHLEVSTYFQDGTNNSFVTQAEQSTSRELLTNRYQWTGIVPTENGVPMASQYWADHDNIWVMLRFLELDGNDEIVTASRYYIAPFTMVDSVTGVLPQYLGALDLANFELSLIESTDPVPSNTSAGGTNYVAGLVPQSRLPDEAKPAFGGFDAGPSMQSY